MSGQIDFFLFLNPPNVPVLIPKQFSDFEKIKKIQERILLHQKLEEKNPKNVFLKAERVVKSIFSFSLTPLNVAFLIPKQFSDFEKSKKKTPFTPKIGKIQKMSI